MALGATPSRRTHDKLTEAGAKRIFFDVNFAGRSTAADDALLAKAINQAPVVVLPVSARFGTPDIRHADPYAAATPAARTSSWA